MALAPPRTLWLCCVLCVLEKRPWAAPAAARYAASCLSKSLASGPVPSVLMASTTGAVSGDAISARAPVPPKWRECSMSFCARAVLPWGSRGRWLRSSGLGERGTQA
eukprot:4329970-Prymnesium_polylepis.1